MTKTATLEKPSPAPRTTKPKLHVGGKPPAAAAPPARPAPPAPPAIVPSSPEPVTLGRLHRAPENVRHIRPDEDVDALVASIGAHGLLQSLIGYRKPKPGHADRIMVVGGGRRLQALVKLWEDGRVDGDFSVPVLIRDVEEAVELSLAENLEQKTMSPVDEFRAFKALIDTGHHSPTTLAKRFGFSERVVKQRLRLADLAPEVLDALAERRITIDAAQAYATTQDQRLQSEIFKVQDRKGWEPHRPHAIRSDIGLKGVSTTDAVFLFVGAERYERDGGGYEDDLFADDGSTRRDGRTLDKPFLARAAAEQMISERAGQLVERFRADPKLAPTVTGIVTPESLRLYSWGTSDKLKAPAGFVEVDRRYGDEIKVWKTIRNNGIEAHVLVGINDKGELIHNASRLFVPKAQKNAVDQQHQAQRAPEPTAEERAAQSRAAEVSLWSKRLAVGRWTGTPLEGRAVWPSGYDSQPTRVTRAGEKGWAVPIRIFVTDSEVEANAAAAEGEADRRIAERAALAARRAELQDLDPPPAVIEINGSPCFRWANDSWHTRPTPESEGDPIEDADTRVAWRTYGVLQDAGSIGRHWPTLEAYQADQQNAGGEA